MSHVVGGSVTSQVWTTARREPCPAPFPEPRVWPFPSAGKGAWNARARSRRTTGSDATPAHATGISTAPHAVPATDASTSAPQARAVRGCVVRPRRAVGHAARRRPTIRCSSRRRARRRSGRPSSCSAVFDAGTDVNAVRTALGSAPGLDPLLVAEQATFETRRGSRVGARMAQGLPSDALRTAALGVPRGSAPGAGPDAAGAAVILELDPGLAFGTGTHATTALCLEWLDSARSEGDWLSGAQVIDYGCGSGILAIAAVLLGAERALGDGHRSAGAARHEPECRTQPCRGAGPGDQRSAGRRGPGRRGPRQHPCGTAGRAGPAARGANAGGRPDRAERAAGGTGGCRDSGLPAVV